MTNRTTLEPDKKMLQLFWYYISERYRVYKKKTVEKLPPPWTADKALSDWHYCCVYREDDKGTVYLRDVLAKCADNGEKLYNIAVFRLLGSDIGQFSDLSGSHGIVSSTTHPPSVIKDWANGRLSRGERAVGHGAYLPPAPSYNRLTHTKTEAIVEYVIGYVWSNLYSLLKDVERSSDMADVYNTFLRIPGCGNFYAQELTQDCLDAGITSFTEEGDWTNAGPGAERGLRLIFPSIERGELEDGIRLLRELHDYRELGLPKPLTLRSTEHNLCEVYKYVRAHEGGRNRRRYRSKIVISNDPST